MNVDIGQLAPNLEPEFTQWRTGAGDDAEWTLVADGSAEGGHAIAQVSRDKTNYRFPLAIYTAFSGKDLEVSVRFKPVAGTVDQAGGIAVRLLTPDAPMHSKTMCTFTGLLKAGGGNWPEPTSRSPPMSGTRSR
jgi:hypothetical protein